MVSANRAVPRRSGGGSPLPASSSYSTNGSRGESRGFGTLGVVPFHVRIVGSASLGSDVTAVAESFRAVASNRPMMKIIVHEGIGSGNHTYTFLALDREVECQGSGCFGLSAAQSCFKGRTV